MIRSHFGCKLNNLWILKKLKEAFTHTLNSLFIKLMHTINNDHGVTEQNQKQMQNMAAQF